MRYWPKGCERCGGDLFEAWDIREGFYLSCIQCSHTPSSTEELITTGANKSPRRTDRAPSGVPSRDR